jgi:hypothetical protein
MTDAPAADPTSAPAGTSARQNQAPTENDDGVEAFRKLDQTLLTGGAAAALDSLIEHLSAAGKYRALLDALLLKARHELKLPLVQEGSLAGLPEPVRTQFEARYVEAIRLVGTRLLEAGDIAGAWPYFRAIGETEPVAQAIEAYAPAADDERAGAIIEIAFNQGANPRRGFELILEHYGTCSAITAFEHLSGDEANRVAAADQLVQRLHEDLVASLRADIAQRGQPLPPEGTPIAGLIASRPWLFADDTYHIDISHLNAVVRIAPLLEDPATIAQAVGLCDYGRNLSARYRSEGEPPFEDHFEDHGAYLGALLGQDADAAVARFRAKLVPPGGDDDGPEGSLPAQVLVGLLLRLGRLGEAIDVAAEHLAGVPESALGCPSVAQLCQRAGQPARLAGIARAQGDLVRYVAAILQAGPPEG